MTAEQEADTVKTCRLKLAGQISTKGNAGTLKNWGLLPSCYTRELCTGPDLAPWCNQRQNTCFLWQFLLFAWPLSWEHSELYLGKREKPSVVLGTVQRYYVLYGVPTIQNEVDKSHQTQVLLKALWGYRYLQILEGALGQERHHPALNNFLYQKFLLAQSIYMLLMLISLLTLGIPTGQLFHYISKGVTFHCHGW